MLRLLLLILSSAVLFGCATSRRGERVFSKKLVRQIEASPVFAQSFTGFALADTETGKILAASNADKYFTPASNTKILTLYTCLRMLGDSLPGMEYAEVDTLGFVFRGTGDPTFLHPKFQAWQPAFHVLNSKGKAALMPATGRMADERLGIGWSWDDYDTYYSPERSEFPIFGNCAYVQKTAWQWHIRPRFFEQNLRNVSLGTFRRRNFNRAETANLFFFDEKNTAGQADSEPIEVPIFNVEKMQPYLLADTLFGIANFRQGMSGRGDMGIAGWRTLHSCPTDTVLRRMMYQSDNFIAEQLLLVCAGLKYNELSQKKIIQWAQDSLLTGLKQPPKWVDGSGLSRYNLNTPSNNVEILRRLWREQAHERLFSLFPAGGTVDTTLAEWFAPKPGERPYVFAKSGSMSGVYCLSGYVVGRSGRVLAFSFMHNNFVGSNRAWKAETQRFLAQIREKG